MEEDMGDEVISAPAVLAAGGAMAAMPASASLGAAASGGLGYAAADGTVVAERPHFSPLSHAEASGNVVEIRSIPVPAHRYTPLKNHWDEVMTPLIEHLHLLIRFNPRKRAVELKTSELTTEPTALQKAEDFVRAFMLGFEVVDAIALLRLDDLFVESFEVQDVKPLKGDHLSRAIGRIAGHGGRTKVAIENATRTRLVVADSKIHILGAYANIQIARDAICSLILGAPPGKVYNQMRQVAARLHQRY